MLNYTLGTIEASEALIKDLYIDLRAKVNAWSKITQQTPNASGTYGICWSAFGECRNRIPWRKIRCSWL